MTQPPLGSVTPEQWSRIGELFSAALDVEPEARSAFVISEAGSDVHLATEVNRLLRLQEEAGDFLESPALCLLAPETPPLLRAGDVVADRFLVSCLRGRGGMGEVYEAHDRLLDEPVALKVMRPGLADPVAIADRFRSEVQLARRISHPAVCRVHDVAFHTLPGDRPLIVLTMELLTGETLAARLRREPLDRDEAFHIIEQVGQALDTAHAMRIGHGDVKPENIFLVDRSGGRPRVVLTDFGLARAFETELAASSPDRGPRFGTPAYMPPEQLRGEPPTLAGDLYAFGVVISQMLSRTRGRRSQRAGRVLARALDPDPDRRFSTAAQIVGRLSPRLAGRTRVFLAILVVLALLAAWLRIYQHERPALRPASELLVVDTVNDTGDPRFDGGSELLRSQLAQSPYINIVSVDRVRTTLGQMRRDGGTTLTRALAREVALRQGAALVLYSTIAQAAGGFVLKIDLERVGARPSFARAHWVQQFNATNDADLFAAAHQATLWARQMTGEPEVSLADQDRPPAETTTSSWEALRLFTKANQRQAIGQSAEAILLLDQALELDPDFATAHMRRADILIGLGRDSEGYAAWREAIQRSGRHEVTSREHLRIRAQYFEDTGDWAEAEKAYRTYVLHYPNDPDAAFLLGSVLRMRGLTPEAIAWFERATQLRPGWFVPLVHSATALLESGRGEAAAAAIARLRAEGHAEYATWLEGVAAIGAGEPGRALQAIEPLRTSAEPSWVSRGFTLRGAWLAEEGRDADAIAELTAGIEFDRLRGFQGAEADKWLHLAHLYRARQDTSACAAAALRAVALAPNASRVMQAGVLLAAVGRVADAETALRYFDSQPPVPRINVARDRLESAIELRKGRVARAMELAARASAADSQYPARLYLAETLRAGGDPAAAASAIEADLREPARLYRSPDPPVPGIWRETREFHDSLPKGGTRDNDR